MKNVMVTNMDNGTTIILTKEQFDSCRTCLSENSVYEYTNMPPTQISIARQCGKSSLQLDHISKVLGTLGGFKDEIDRTAIIRL